MEDTPATRSATAARVGPWFVLQRKNPTAPGLRYAVLLSLVKRGLVTTDSILRGPTTQQLWRRATQVRGVARAFGVCWKCNSSVSPEASTCTRCGESQEPPADPDLFLEASKDARQSSGIEAKSIDDGFESPQSPTPREFITRDQPQRGANEVIMSARELAAVFQLNPSAVRQPSRARRLFDNSIKFIVATILIATTGIAALLYVKPELREPIRKKFGGVFEGQQSTPAVTDDYKLPSIVSEEPVRLAIDSDPPAPTPPQVDSNSIKPDVETNRIDLIESQPIDEKPVEVVAVETKPEESRSTEPVPTWLDLFNKSDQNEAKTDDSVSNSNDLTTEVADESPTTQPDSTVSAEPDNAKVEIQPPEPVTIVPTEQPKEEIKPGDEPAMPNLADPYDQLRELRTMASDFERKQNFAFAIRCYELMRELPEAVRPTNIETQIDRLKRRAGIED